MTPLDELEDPGIIEQLLPEVGGGEWEAFPYMPGGGARPFPLGFVFASRDRHHCVLMVRVTNYKQKALTCGLSAVESHLPEADVFAVQHTKETFTRRWYKRLVAEPDPEVEYTLHSTLEWIRETTVAPTTLRMVYDGEGETITQPECVPSVDGEYPPEHWDGYDDVDYYWYSEDAEPVYEDSSLITGSALVSAAQGGEIVSYDDADYGVVKEFGRSWFQSNSLSVPVGAAIASQIGEVKRAVLRFKVVGHRIPFKLKWKKQIFGEGGSTTDEEHQFGEVSGWEHTIEAEYPDYGKDGSLHSFYVLPV